MNFAQDVQSSLDNLNFIKLVRPLCVLTQGASSFISDDDIIFQGLQQFKALPKSEWQTIADFVAPQHEVEATESPQLEPFMKHQQLMQQLLTNEVHVGLRI